MVEGVGDAYSDTRAALADSDSGELVDDADTHAVLCENEGGREAYGARADLHRENDGELRSGEQ